MSNIICHIAGASGSGKTTILEEINKLWPHIVAKDLDEFDDEACQILGFDGIPKKNWPNERLRLLAEKRQEIMDKFIEEQTQPIVFAGHHWEDIHILHIPTEHKFMLDVDAETSAQRAYRRSQNGDLKHRRTLEELPLDIADAKKDIDFILSQGYEKKSPEEILKFIEQYIPMNE